jgi:uncharacterized membrane protein YfcA
MSSDCNSYPYEICSDLGTCEHKPIFPMELTEFLGLIVLPTLMALCNAAGVGGGGLQVPLCMIFFKFSTKNAIALSGFAIFMGSLTRYIYNINARHPEKDAVVVDYGLASVMMPTVLIGSLLGVFINLMCPALVLLVFLTVVILFLVVNSIYKSAQIYMKENAE